MKNIFSIVFSPVINCLSLPQNLIIGKIIDLYGSSQFSSQFVKIRFWDSPYLEVEKFVAKKGTILELGCGEGIFSNFLAFKSAGRQVLGIDLDRERIREADRGLINTKFKFGNATKVKLDKFDSIILFHLLHHLKNYKEQVDVIKKCTESLNKNGQLIIVEVDIKFTFKYVVSWVVDCLIVPWLFERCFFTPVHYLGKNEWGKILKDQGLKYKVHTLEKGKPFTHVVFEAYRNN